MIKKIENKELIECNCTKLILEYMLECKMIKCYCFKNDKICIDYTKEIDLIEEMKNVADAIFDSEKASLYKLLLELKENKI